MRHHESQGRTSITRAAPVAALLLCAAAASRASSRSPVTEARRSGTERRPPTWNEALPLGNGRLGAMVFGGTGTEHLQLNEETLWTGGPYDPVVRGAAARSPRSGASSLRATWRGRTISSAVA